jgi:hypothetical protein
MVKEAAEIVGAILDFFRSPRIVATVFLCSGMWLVPPIRRMLPVQGDIANVVNLVVSVCFTLSAAGLVVTGIVWIHSALTAEERVQARKLQKALRQTTPVEKEVLKTLISLGKWEVCRDAGSVIAMHLQQIGLIAKSFGRPGVTTYQMAQGLSDICIEHPKLLQQPEDVESGAIAEIEEWGKAGAHRGFFRQLQPPSSTSWMG